jgi:hypothetical protein
MSASPTRISSACSNSATSHRFTCRAIRTIVAMVVLLTASAMPAFAVSVADIVALAKAGLGDDVLIALIQTDNTVFPLDAQRILELRAAGVSERVIIEMLKNGRTRPDASSAPELGYIPYDGMPSSEVPQPPAAPVVVQVQAPQPALASPIFYFPYPMVSTLRGGVRHRGVGTGYRGFGRFINDGWVEPRRSHRSAP